MQQTIEQLQQLYPGAQAWAFGDSPQMADELAVLVARGVKTATCGSLVAYQQEGPEAMAIGSYHVVLNGSQQPVCVIRISSLGLIRYCDMSAPLAALEGEGDLSLEAWRTGHREFFSREGTFSDEMELVFTTFRVVHVVRT